MISNFETLILLLVFLFPGFVAAKIESVITHRVKEDGLRLTLNLFLYSIMINAALFFVVAVTLIFLGTGYSYSECIAYFNADAARTVIILFVYGSLALLISVLFGIWRGWSIQKGKSLEDMVHKLVQTSFHDQSVWQHLISKKRDCSIELKVIDNDDNQYWGQLKLSPTIEDENQNFSFYLTDVAQKSVKDPPDKYKELECNGIYFNSKNIKRILFYFPQRENSVTPSEMNAMPPAHIHVGDGQG